MTIIQAIVLGIIQGITELLPISSSGHLALVPKLLGWEVQSIVFDEFVHMASFLAILIFFWKDLWKIATDTIKSLGKLPKFFNSMGFKLVIATIPTLIVGVLFKDKIEELTGNHVVIAISLISLGIVFLFIETLVKNNKKILDQVSVKDSLVVGLAQPIALIRGVSRSGVTITAGLFSGLTKESAARFSFYMSAVVMAALSVKGVYDIFTHPNSETLLVIIVGSIASFLSSLLAIKLLFVAMKTNTFKWFGIYRIILGIITLLLLS
ncbi:undecaprenyl-diphosphate phosphatase [Candidatus Dojkabacteria bacterium]|nr:undecaprenyl-diphosphate phosphatase [Candidatus Dojkabacteria bacterium]